MADKIQNFTAKSARAAPASDGDLQTVKNAILLELPRKERGLVLSKSEFVALPAHTVLTEMSEPIEFCYFLNSGVVPSSMC